MVVEVVYGSYNVEALVAREEECDPQVEWGGHGIPESGLLTSSCKSFIHVILAFRCLRTG